MTAKQKQYRIGLLRAIHLCDKYKEIKSHGGDEMWVDFLYDKLGTNSSANLSITELVRLHNYLTDGNTALQKEIITTNQANMLIDLWVQNSRNKDQNSLLIYVKRIVKEDLNNINNLAKRNFKTMIQAIKKLKQKQHKITGGYGIRPYENKIPHNPKLRIV